MGGEESGVWLAHYGNGHVNPLPWGTGVWGPHPPVPQSIFPLLPSAPSTLNTTVSGPDSRGSLPTGFPCLFPVPSKPFFLACFRSFRTVDPGSRAQLLRPSHPPPCDGQPCLLALLPPHPPSSTTPPTLKYSAEPGFSVWSLHILFPMPGTLFHASWPASLWLILHLYFLKETALNLESMLFILVLVLSGRSHF